MAFVVWLEQVLNSHGADGETFAPYWLSLLQDGEEDIASEIFGPVFEELGTSPDEARELANEVCARFIAEDGQDLPSAPIAEAQRVPGMVSAVPVAEPILTDSNGHSGGVDVTGGYAAEAEPQKGKKKGRRFQKLSAASLGFSWDLPEDRKVLIEGVADASQNSGAVELVDAFGGSISYDECERELLARSGSFDKAYKALRQQQARKFSEQQLLRHMCTLLREDPDGRLRLSALGEDSSVRNLMVQIGHEQGLKSFVLQHPDTFEAEGQWLTMTTKAKARVVVENISPAAPCSAVGRATTAATAASANTATAASANRASAAATFTAAPADTAPKAAKVAGAHVEDPWSQSYGMSEYDVSSRGPEVCLPLEVLQRSSALDKYNGMERVICTSEQSWTYGYDQSPRPWFGYQQDIGRVRWPVAGSELPIAAHRSDIIDMVQQSQVTLIHGETGSGKSTQVPKYLLQATQADTHIGSVRIVVVEPRRLAVTSLARRVAEELGEELGQGVVGYRVRGSSCLDSMKCRLLFCTTGLLLKRLQRLGKGQMFTAETVTHLIVDEVHERSCETDLLLTMLRQELPGRPQLRLILMSATMNAERFAQFFQVPAGATQRHDVQVEDVVVVKACAATPGTGYLCFQGGEKVFVGFVGSGDEAGWLFGNLVGAAHEAGWFAASTVTSIEPRLLKPSTISVPGRCFPVAEVFLEEIVASVGEDTLPPDHVLAVDSGKAKAYKLKEYMFLHALISRIVTAGPWEFVPPSLRPAGVSVIGGAILVFLPGVAEITDAISALGQDDRLYCLPLHGGLSEKQQRQAFQPPPSGRLKVICSTNVAETSITLPDVTCVVDSCRERRVTLDPLSGTPSLQECWCAQDALRQRQGRAGRVQPGVCFRLVPREGFEAFQTATEPELCRVPLEGLYLSILASKLGDPKDFLKQAPDPPDEATVLAAERALSDLGALAPAEIGNESVDGLSALGRILSRLPTHPRLGKILVLGCLLRCPRATISIVAALSIRSPFLPHQGSAVEAARVELSAACGGATDHCLWQVLLEQWQESWRDSERCNEICWKYGLSWTRLTEALYERERLAQGMIDAGLLPKSYYIWDPMDATGIDHHSLNYGVVQGVVCAALYPNVIKIEANGTRDVQMSTREGQVYLHPGSVCFWDTTYRCTLLSYFRLQRTKKLFAYDVTCPANLVPLVLFVDDVTLGTDGNLCIGGWVQAHCKEACLQMLQALRDTAKGLVADLAEGRLSDGVLSGTDVTGASALALDVLTEALSSDAKSITV